MRSSKIQLIKRHVESANDYLIYARGVTRPTPAQRRNVHRLVGMVTDTDAMVRPEIVVKTKKPSKPTK